MLSVLASLPASQSTVLVRRAVTLACPRCASGRIGNSHHARKASVAVGGLAGAVASATTSWGRARVAAQVGLQVGAGIGLVAGPAGATVSAVAGAVLAGLAGAAAGAAVGAALGEFLDANLLDNHHCVDCGHRFSQTSARADATQPTPGPSVASPTARHFQHTDWEHDDHNGLPPCGLRD